MRQWQRAPRDQVGSCLTFCLWCGITLGCVQCTYTVHRQRQSKNGSVRVRLAPLSRHDMEDARSCSARSILTRANVLLIATAGTKVEDARGLLESAVHFSESTFKAVWDGSIQEQPAKLQGEAAGSLGLGAPYCCLRLACRPALRAVHGGWEARPGTGMLGHAAGAPGLPHDPLGLTASSLDTACPHALSAAVVAAMEPMLQRLLSLQVSGRIGCTSVWAWRSSAARCHARWHARHHLAWCFEGNRCPHFALWRR